MESTITINITEEDGIATIYVSQDNLCIDDTIMYLELALESARKANTN